MARDKGQIYEASDWFKEALQINQVLWHPCVCVFTTDIYVEPGIEDTQRDMKQL